MTCSAPPKKSLWSKALDVKILSNQLQNMFGHRWTIPTELQTVDSDSNGELGLWDRQRKGAPNTTMAYNKTVRKAKQSAQSPVTVGLVRLIQRVHYPVAALCVLLAS
jgi:hypothetical protein